MSARETSSVIIHIRVKWRDLGPHGITQNDDALLNTDGEHACYTHTRNIASINTLCNGITYPGRLLTKYSRVISSDLVVSSDYVNSREAHDKRYSLHGINFLTTSFPENYERYDVLIYTRCYLRPLYHGGQQ